MSDPIPKITVREMFSREIAKVDEHLANPDLKHERGMWKRHKQQLERTVHGLSKSELDRNAMDFEAEMKE